MESMSGIFNIKEAKEDGIDFEGKVARDIKSIRDLVEGQITWSFDGHNVLSDMGGCWKF